MQYLWRRTSTVLELFSEENNSACHPHGLGASRAEKMSLNLLSNRCSLKTSTREQREFPNGRG